MTFPTQSSSSPKSRLTGTFSVHPEASKIGRHAVDPSVEGLHALKQNRSCDTKLCQIVRPLHGER